MVSEYPSASSILKINLSALADNYSALKAKANGAAVAGVLKANAYGNGVNEAFDTLYHHSCEHYFVATLNEGITLRKRNEEVRIYILNGYFEGAEELYKDHNLIPVIGSLSALQRAKDYKQACILHFDTGMNRLGFDADETAQILSQARTITDELHIEYIMSHFACADEKDHPLNAQQCENFEKIAQHFPNTPKTLCNSSGIYHTPNHHYDLVRPGYALYGGNPTPEDRNPMAAVVGLYARILQVRDAKAGENVGYGASYSCPIDKPLATISLGYADGFLRSGSNRVKAYYNGVPCPIVGRISMDLATISLEAIANSPPQAGDYVEIIGTHQSIDQLAHDCGTIGYELLTSLSRRAQRIYL